jgi:hypothetical protein
MSIRVAAATATDVQTGRDLSGEPPRIELSAEKCLTEFQRIGAWETRFDDIFRNHPLLCVYYEDLVSDGREGDRILDFIGVSNRRLSTNLVRQQKESLSRVIRNYDDLKAHLAGTEWREYFEE